jgi:hypothetical protein
MRVAIVGSRDYPGLPDEVVQYVYKRLEEDDIVISGGARGVDTSAANAANARGLKVVVHPAKWDEFGKSAGYKRNVTIVEDCDRLVAFWDGTSKGTKHSIDLAHKLGKPVEVFMP